MIYCFCTDEFDCFFFASHFIAFHCTYDWTETPVAKEEIVEETLLTPPVHKRKSKWQHWVERTKNGMGTDYLLRTTHSLLNMDTQHLSRIKASEDIFQKFLSLSFGCISIWHLRYVPFRGLTFFFFSRLTFSSIHPSWADPRTPTHTHKWNEKDILPVFIRWIDYEICHAKYIKLFNNIWNISRVFHRWWIFSPGTRKPPAKEVLGLNSMSKATMDKKNRIGQIPSRCATDNIVK